MAIDTATEQRSRVTTTISKDAMTASVLLRVAQDSDPAITVEEVMEALEKNEVVFGTDEKMIGAAVEGHEYNTPVRVAVGRKPTRGASSSIIYHFETSQDLKPSEDEDGRIDYKDINFIQNIEKDAKLATRVPATPGTPGMTVLGKEIQGPPGKDIPFKNGVNTEISEDGLELKATASGAIQFTFEKISVMDIITISGDVDHRVGNVDCRGSVRVTGGVKAGYGIKCDGDLEVTGNVEDSDIRVGGNIAVKGGCFGEKEGILEAGGSITVKYAEGQKLLAGTEITVGGEIINCHVEAGDNVLVKGSRGKIVGGNIRARREIRAAVFGSDAGTATLLQVAYDPDLMKQYTDVVKELKRVQEDATRVKEALYVLYRFQMESKLPPEKQVALEKLEKFQKELPENLKGLQAEKAEIEASLAEYDKAVMICEEKLYAGVKASFGIIYREIVEEKGRCKMTLDAGKVMISEFREE